MKALHTVLWGLFCACSWTWCIGMYLPILLMERWAWPGFAVFLIANVVGCAAFGYIVRTPARSERMIRDHAPAMVGFSVVAIAFHLFFITYLFTDIVPLDANRTLPLLAAIGVYVVASGLSWLGDRAWLVLAVVTYTVSMWLIAGCGGETRALERIAGWNQPETLLMMLPVLVAGFWCCPRLDLTFHRALQRSPSRHAFLVFGVAFAALVAGTLFIWRGPEDLAVVRLGVAHLLAQSVFTVGAHLREIRLVPASGGTPARSALLLIPLLTIMLLPAFKSIVSGVLRPGEDLYIRFFVFYGLIFPAYVMAFMTSGASGAPRPRGWIILAMIVLLLAPIYEIGFIHERYAWMLVPTGIAAAWLVMRRRVAPWGMKAPVDEATGAGSNDS